MTLRITLLLSDYAIFQGILAIVQAKTAFTDVLDMHKTEIISTKNDFGNKTMTYSDSV
jgi:hypothetical protein